MFFALFLSNREKVIEYLEKYTENMRRTKNRPIRQEKSRDALVSRESGNKGDTIDAGDVLMIGLTILRIFAR